MEKAREFCKLFMWAVIGSFIGRALHVYFFYKKHPGYFLELMSEPWYAQLLVPLVFTAAVTVILIAVRVILKKKDREQ